MKQTLPERVPLSKAKGGSYVNHATYHKVSFVGRFGFLLNPSCGSLRLVRRLS